MAEEARFILAASSASVDAAAGSAEPPVDARDILGMWQRAPATPPSGDLPLSAGSAAPPDGVSSEPVVVWRVDLPARQRDAAAALRESAGRLWTAYAALPDVPGRVARASAAAREGKAAVSFESVPLAAAAGGESGGPEAQPAAAAGAVAMTPDEELLLLLGEIANPGVSTAPSLGLTAPDEAIAGEGAGGEDLPLAAAGPSTFGRIVDWLTRRRSPAAPDEPGDITDLEHLEDPDVDVDREDDSDDPENLRRAEEDLRQSDREDVSERPDILRRLRQREKQAEDHWPVIDTRPQPETPAVQPVTDQRPADERLATDARSFFDTLQAVLGRLSLVQTTQGGRAVGWTYVSWDGQLTSYYRPGAGRQEIALHSQAVQQALFTRETWLRIGLAIAGGLASLGATLAGNPLSILAVYRYVRQIIAQAQRL